MENTDAHESLTCPVCWDVFYNAYACQPCGHIFCEPCLRRLAKCHVSSGTLAPCPICRQVIAFCAKDHGKLCMLTLLSLPSVRRIMASHAMLATCPICRQIIAFCAKDHDKSCNVGPLFHLSLTSVLRIMTSHVMLAPFPICHCLLCEGS